MNIHDFFGGLLVGLLIGCIAILFLLRWFERGLREMERERW